MSTDVLAEPWAWACAALAGLTAFLLVAAPPRLRGLGPDAAAGRSEGRLRRLARGRPDAAPAGQRVLVCALAALALCALVTRFAPSALWCWAVAAPVSVVSAVALGWLEPAAARRRRHHLVLQTPQALELLAACLAAGMPVRRACAAVVDAFDGPVAEDLGRVSALTELGVGDADAWHALAVHPQLGPAAADLARSVESGTLLVEGLRHHASRARDQRQAALQVLARSVGVRSVLPLMTCFIPSFILLGVVPSVASALSHALHL